MTTTINIYLLQQLPRELCDYIFELCGYHKYRNGKYMRQLDKTKPIINRLLHMPQNIHGFLELPIKIEELQNIIYRKKIRMTVVIYTLFEDERILKTYECGWYNSLTDDKLIKAEEIQYIAIQ
jgi:hypothetical protein